MTGDRSVSTPAVVPVQFVCPLCKGPLAERPGAYICTREGRTYRVVFGIPDFRVFPDPYIDLEAEDRKIDRLLAEYPRCAFGDLVALYYRLTPEVPADLARKYTRHVETGEVRAKGTLAAARREGAAGGRLLDIGCGTGGLLVAAGDRYRWVCGVDIALRWLLIARKRLEASGSNATLVCACAEYLPFPDNAFDLVIAADLLEHARAPDDAVREAHRVLGDAGVLVATTPNRWTIGPDPHVRVPFVGFLPERWRDPYVRLTRRISYRHVRTLTWFDLRRLFQKRWTGPWRAQLPELERAYVERLSRGTRLAARAYRLLRRTPVTRAALLLFGPLLEVVARKR